MLVFDVVGPYECASTGDAHSVANQGCDPKRPAGKYRLGQWSPLLDADFGQPLGAPTVEGKLWKRRWSKASVSLDCGSYEASIDFNALIHPSKPTTRARKRSSSLSPSKQGRKD
jgi:hypothetical protein